MSQKLIYHPPKTATIPQRYFFSRASLSVLKRDTGQHRQSKSQILPKDILSRTNEIGGSSMIRNEDSMYNLQTPKWNQPHNIESAQMNQNLESQSRSRYYYDLDKNQTSKLQKNYETLKDHVTNVLHLMEQEFRTIDVSKGMEFKKSKDVLISLVSQLSEAAKNEVKLSLMSSDNNSRSEQVTAMKRQIEQLQGQLHQQQVDMKQMKEMKEQSDRELMKKNKETIFNQKKNLNDKQTIESLQKRLELLLETSFVEYASNPNNGQSQQEGLEQNNILISSGGSGSGGNSNKQRLLLSELVRDNEKLKKDCVKLEIEVLRLQSNEQKLNKKLASLNSKIEGMKKKISEKDLESLQQEEKILQSLHTENTLQRNSSNLLKRLVIPQDTDFRFNTMKFEFSQILNEIIEHGSNNFVAHVNRNKNPEKRTKLLSLLANQFISYRDFCNRFVSTIKELHNFANLDDLKLILTRVSLVLPSILKAQNVHLWINQAQTALMYSFNKEGKNMCCLPGKGIFQDIIRSKLPINIKSQVQNRYLYVSMNDSDDIPLTGLSHAHMQLGINQSMQQTCSTSFCLPILYEEEVIAILEASESTMIEGFGQDEELFGVICANFLSVIISRLKKEREQAVILKFSDILNSCFLKCLESPSLLSLEKKVHLQLQKFFGIDVCKFYFVEPISQSSNQSQKDKLQIQDLNNIEELPFSSFFSNLTNERYNYKKGIIGEAACQMSPILLDSIKDSASYDPFVDLKTILPVLTVPLIIKNEVDNSHTCLGVLQVPLKKRTMIAKEKEKYLLGATPLLGIDSSLENTIKTYSKYLGDAIKIVKGSIGQQIKTA